MSGPPRPPPNYLPTQQQQQQQHQQIRSNTLPSFPPPGLSDIHPPSFEMDDGSGLQSFAASPEEWEEGSPGPPGSKVKVTGAGADRKPIATRRRVVQSCSECRRRKIKCDKKWVGLCFASSRGGLVTDPSGSRVVSGISQEERICLADEQDRVYFGRTRPSVTK